MLAIPTQEEIVAYDSYTLDEMDEMLRTFNGLNISVTKQFQKELDSVVHPTDNYSSTGEHHQPHFQQAEDLEQSIKDMFNEFENITYVPDRSDDTTGVDGFADIYKMNSFHYFRGCIKFDTFMFKMLTYYSLVYRIFKLEYFTCKANSSAIDILDLERYVYNGSDYWKIMEEKETSAVDENFNFEMYSDSEDSDIENNTVSKHIIRKVVHERRRRVKLQDDLENMHESIEKFTNRLENLPEKNLNTILEYATLYHESRYSRVVYCIDRVLEKIYDDDKIHEDQSSIKQIKSLLSLLKQFSHRDISYIPWFNFRYYGNYQEYYSKTRDSINDQAMNPQQIEQVEKMYPAVKFLKNTFSGQEVSQPYECLDYEILDLSKENRAYIQSSANTLRGIITDYLEIFKLSNKKGAANLRDRNDVMKTLILRSQLKFALFSWYSCSDYPSTPDQFKLLSSKFKDDLYKKILEQKKTYLKSIEAVVGDTKFNSNIQDEDLALNPLEKERIKMQRIKAMSRYTLVELISQAKAEIIVIRDEIDRILMIHAIDIIEKEFAAISASIDCESSDISALIHPFQQFASVCFPTVDKHSHLDMINKVSAVQKCLTRLKNRCTEVETLTSGPGIVFTIKDFNECIQMLCRDLIKYSEIELRSRSETAVLKENHLLHLVYMKDKVIQNLESRIQNSKKNMDKLISAYLYEHGNKIIYELDVSKRQLRTFKDNIFKMEHDLREKIKYEYQNTIRKNIIQIESTKRSFMDFKTDISTKIKSDILQAQQKNEKAIKQMAFNAKQTRTKSHSEVTLNKNHQYRVQREHMKGHMTLRSIGKVNFDHIINL